MTAVAPRVATAILRRPDVERLTRLSKATIYRLAKSGEFPTPIRLGVRAVAWRASDVEAWLASRTPVSYDRGASKRGVDE